MLKDGELFLCARVDGDVAPARVSGEGFYASDTRYLSEIRLKVGGARPVALSHTAFGDRAVLDATNATLGRGSDSRVPQLSLSITRELTIAAGRLYHLVRVRNFLRKPVTTVVSLALAADYADMFEVRGFPRRDARGHALAPKQTERGLTLAYVGEDEVFRETVVELDPIPDQLDLAADRALARWRVTLEPGVPVAILMSAEPSIGGRRRPRRRPATATGELREAEARWRSRCTTIDERQRAVQQADRYLRAGSARVDRARSGRADPRRGHPLVRGAVRARRAHDRGRGADAQPRPLTRDALVSLAKLQATEDDPWRDAEPGKILHELRVGELAGAGLVPHSPYYGTVDATPLFLMRAADYYDWTGDLETLRLLRPALDAALSWIDELRRPRRRRVRRVRAPLERRACATRAGRTRRTRSSTPMAVSRRGRSHSSRRRATSTRPSARSPRSTMRLRCRRSPRVCAPRPASCARRSTRRSGTPTRGRSRSRSTDASGRSRASPPTPATASTAESSIPRRRTRWSSACWRRTCSAAGESAPSRASARLQPDELPQRLGVAARQRDHRRRAQALRTPARACWQIADCLFEVATGARDSRLPELYCGFERSERAAVVAYPVACIPQAWAAAAPLLVAAGDARRSPRTHPLVR